MAMSHFFQNYMFSLKLRSSNKSKNSKPGCYSLLQSRPLTYKNR